MKSLKEYNVVSEQRLRRGFVEASADQAIGCGNGRRRRCDPLTTAYVSSPQVRRGSLGCVPGQWGGGAASRDGNISIPGDQHHHQEIVAFRRTPVSHAASSTCRTPCLETPAPGGPGSKDISIGLSVQAPGMIPKACFSISTCRKIGSNMRLLE